MIKRIVGYSLISYQKLPFLSSYSPIRLCYDRSSKTDILEELSSWLGELKIPLVRT